MNISKAKSEIEGLVNWSNNEPCTKAWDVIKRDLTESEAEYKTKYHIMSNQNPSTLSHNVNERLEKGWEAQGSLVLGPHMYYQVIIKKVKVDND